MAKILWRHRINLVFRNTRPISKLSKLCLSIFCKRDLKCVQMKGLSLFKWKMIAEREHTLTTFRCIEIINRRHYSFILFKQKRHLSTTSDNNLKSTSNMREFMFKRSMTIYLEDNIAFISFHRNAAFKYRQYVNRFTTATIHCLSYRPSRTYSPSRKIKSWQP